MKNNYFITGIGTDVGKTVVAAIFTEALQADYWKPVQSGLEETDIRQLQSLVSNTTSVFHPEAYRLVTPMSPHQSAKMDGIEVDLKKILRPQTDNDLVVEGAGGLLVPLNEQQTIADLILPDDRVILVSRGYLGSINHTLLTIEALKSRGIHPYGIVYNDVQREGTIEVIEKMTQVPALLHLKAEEQITPEVIASYAAQLKEVL